MNHNLETPADAVRLHQVNQATREAGDEGVGLLDAALGYWQEGFSVIPVHGIVDGKCTCGKADCQKPGKHPTISWKRYQKERADEAQVRAWFDEHPERNVGIVTGETSGIAVVDIDGEEGFKSIKEAKATGLPLPSTRKVFTGGGGVHLIYRMQNGLSSSTGILKNVDIKAEGGFVVTAPSLHISGNRYKWADENNTTMTVFDFNTLGAFNPGRREKGISSHEGVPEGKRNDTTASYAGRLFRKGLDHDEALSLCLIQNRKNEKPQPEADVIRTVQSIGDIDASKEGKLKQENSARIRKASEGITAADLVKRDFPEPRWAVRGILPEGLVILAGKPKKGKSLFCLNLGLDIASGAEVLNSISAEKGAVLYLALEDTPRRLKERIQQMSDDPSNAPEGLHLYTGWPRMNEGGLEQLEELIERTPDVRLVIIDTLQRFRPPVKGNANVYSEDYEPVAKMKGVADRQSICILLVHHLRKAESSDVFDTLSGSLGLTGAADGILVMEQKKGDMILHVTGRDMESDELAIELDPFSVRWKLLGVRSEVAATKAQREIWDALMASPDPASVSELVKETGVSISQVKKVLTKFMNEGEVKRADRGRYEYIKPLSTSGAQQSLFKREREKKP